MAILGIDEVGRGPWAGPLVIGAVVLPERFDKNNAPIENQAWQENLADSKKLTSKKREKLEPVIKENAKAYGLGWVEASELDEIGLSEALKLATRRAICELLKLSQKQNEKSLIDLPASLPFSEIIIDGTSNFLKGTSLENLVSVLPKADAKIKEVSAASIIAKVARDNYMIELGKQYPGYSFEKHVGYGTAVHKAALEKLGPCPEHRYSFKPVDEAWQNFSREHKQHYCDGRGSAWRFRGEDSNTSPKDAHKTRERAAGFYAGHRAETIVADYLECHGHTILARNYKTKLYEIDIVSATKDHIYFTEVKYRKNSDHGNPLEFIDKKKQKQITFAANSFMNYLSKKLGRELDDLPSPTLAAASVTGQDFKLDKWLEIVI